MEEYTNKFPVTYTKAFADIPENAEIFKFFMMTPSMDKKATAKEFARGVGGLTVTSSFEDNVELSDATAHKGTGLTAVAKHFNIPMEDTVAMGDNYNDSGMLEAAGLSIAMENAEDGIKKISDAVTLTNDEDGVAHAINKYILDQE
jgi:Cof subfamily protein (haloacid dehalogenase superfamily)